MKESTVPAKKEQQNVAKTQEETRERTRAQIPPTDIFELEDALAVVVDLPGVEKEDIDVRVENDTLTIQGAAKAESKGAAIYREFELASYFRQFALTDRVDQTKIDAEMKHGVLTIRLPKAEKAKPKQISVKVS